MLESGKSNSSVALHLGIGETTEQVDASEKLLKTLIRQDFTSKSINFLYLISLIDLSEEKTTKSSQAANPCQILLIVQNN